MKIALLVTAALVSLAAVPASALTYAFTYTSTNTAAPFSATGRITTANMLNANGSYDVLGITGNVDGDVITALVANPNQPNGTTSADGLFNFDNTFSLTAPYITNGGVLFNSVGGFEYNLFSDSPTSYELYQAKSGGYTQNSVGSLSIAAVPEPASWALMLAGFGLVGFASRRSRTVVTA